MQVNVEDKSSVKKILHIEIPKEKVAQEVDAAYDSLKQTVKMKGFRPGKTPKSVLKSVYKKKVEDQVSSDLINQAMSEAFTETGLKVAGVHQIDPPALNEDEAYAFDATVDVFPEIADIDFKGLAITKNIYKVTDVELDTQLAMLQKHVSQTVKVEEDRPLQDDDIAIIDYEGFKDGQPFSETQKTENYTCKMGEKKIAKEFEEKMIGMTPGESREIEISFPADYENENLAGVDILFRVTLNEIRKQILPEINDDFVKNFGDFKTLDELKAQISDNLSKGYEKRTEQEVSEEVFKALIERSSFELPDASVENELDNIIQEVERSFADQNVSFEDAGVTRESLSEKYRDTARKKVRRFLLLNKIVEQEKLEVSDEDMDKGFAEMAENIGFSMDQVKSEYMKNAKGMGFFKQTLLEKNALKLIIDHGAIEEVEHDQVSENQE